MTEPNREILEKQYEKACANEQYKRIEIENWTRADPCQIQVKYRVSTQNPKQRVIDKDGQNYQVSRTEWNVFQFKAKLDKYDVKYYIEGDCRLILDSDLLHYGDLVTRFWARFDEIEAEKCDYETVSESVSDPAPQFWQSEVCCAVWLDQWGLVALWLYFLEHCSEFSVFQHDRSHWLKCRKDEVVRRHQYSYEEALTRKARDALECDFTANKYNIFVQVEAYQSFDLNLDVIAMCKKKLLNLWKIHNYKIRFSLDNSLAICHTIIFSIYLNRAFCIL